MRKKIKKFIAREGLIFLGIMVIGFIALIFLTGIVGGIYGFGGEKIERAFEMGFGLWLGAYPLYLLIRFIIWAIKTLKD